MEVKNNYFAMKRTLFSDTCILDHAGGKGEVEVTF